MRQCNIFKIENVQEWKIIIKNNDLPGYMGEYYKKEGLFGGLNSQLKVI